MSELYSLWLVGLLSSSQDLSGWGAGRGPTALSERGGQPGQWYVEVGDRGLVPHPCQLPAQPPPRCRPRGTPRIDEMSETSARDWDRKAS